MARLDWDTFGERFFEVGVDRGVLYPATGTGVAWSGLLSVNEAPSGGDPRPFYLDGVKYVNFSSAEEYEATINALSSPYEFASADGIARIQNGLLATGQPRKSFGLSYRSNVGNDTEGVDHAYKIHLVYNALAAPADRENKTQGGGADPSPFSWKITTRPPSVTGYKPTAHFVIDSRYTDSDVLSAVEDILYGTDAVAASLPTPDDLIAIFED